MNTPRLLLPAALLLAVAAMPAMAQETGKVTLDENGTPVTVTSEESNSIKGDYHINFAKLDRNHDGYISRDEAKADPTLEREFDAVDTKHAGRLSKAQLEGWMKKK
ncbi:MAG: hypothetical protein ACOH1V_12815 [Stenotrophomonas sp.]